MEDVHGEDDPAEQRGCGPDQVSGPKFALVSNREPDLGTVTPRPAAARSRACIEQASSAGCGRADYAVRIDKMGKKSAWLCCLVTRANSGAGGLVTASELGPRRDSRRTRAGFFDQAILLRHISSKAGMDDI